MIYPNFLNNNSTIGITAPSAGIGKKLNSFDLSIKNLKKHFNIIETKSVRNDNVVSNIPVIRGKEFNELINNKGIDMIFCASGGDYCISSLEYIDFDTLKNNIKWIEGYSDPTSILYYVTTKYDIATIYGNNAGSFDQFKLHKSLEYNIKLLKGNVNKQEKYDLYENVRGENGYNLTEPVIYNNINGNVNETGRIIGGCLDVLTNIIGTKYDYTNEFIERYKDDGIIWYFDIFSLTTEDLYNKLYQFKYADYFKYTKCIIIGRILFKNSFTDTTYEQVLKEVLPDIKIIYNYDLGHVPPKMTIINGSLVHIVSNDKEAYLETYLK